jgi:hypothetical protein
MKRALVVVCLLFFASPRVAAAPEPALVVDRLFLKMLGVAADGDTKRRFIAGKTTLTEIAAELRTDPRFAAQLSRFWLEVFKIDAPADPFSVADSTGTTVNDDIRQTGVSTALRRPLLAYSRRVCTTGVYAGDRNDALDCACGAATTTSPWWAPSVSVPVCPALLADNVCGADLGRCFLADPLYSGGGGTREPGNRYLPDLIEGFTLEPGMMAARVIIDGELWDDTVRGTRTVMNGAMMHFVSTFGRRLLEAAPPGSYLKSGSSSSLGFPDVAPSDPRYLWVERGSLHAGVLTTLAFQRQFNGWRAKATATLDAFLCRRFAVPEGTPQVASLEVDLTRRPYCQTCHIVLEPLAQFFGRWPNLGDTNYLYDPSPSASAVGQYDGVSDADTAGLARVITSHKDFASCAVQRAFEFWTGRSMTSDEQVRLAPKLLATFDESERRLWPVMLAIVETVAFKGE